MTLHTRPVPGSYHVTPPLPTTAELLYRIGTRLLETSGPFNKKWELTRIRCYAQVSQMEGVAKLHERLDAQRESLAYLNRCGSL